MRPYRGSEAAPEPRPRKVSVLPPPSSEIPAAVVDRLPAYYRYLSQMEEAGEKTMSSQEIGEALDMTPAQVRRDFSYFGRLGKQGSGYRVRRLLDELHEVLGLDRRWRMMLVGAGMLGRVVASNVHIGGFDVVRAYAVQERNVGNLVGHVKAVDWSSLEEDQAKDPLRIAILATSGNRTQAAADRIVEAGVRAILNYAATTVLTPPGVEVRDVNPVLALQTMTYYLASDENGAANGA